MVLRYIYGGSLPLEEYDTLDIIKILVASNELIWENVLKWGIAQNPELPSDPFSYSKDDFITLRNTLQKFIPFINFFNLTSKEYLGKVYPYKKIIPKDMRENLFRHFMDQQNRNPEPNITEEIDSMTTSSARKKLSIEKDFNIIVNEVNDLIYELLNKGIGRILIKQKVIEYFNDHNLDVQETYNCASGKNHTLAQIFLGDCYKIGRGTIKNEKLTFEYYEKAANKNLSHGQTSIGYCYENGIGVKKDLIKAFYWYEKAAKNGNITAITKLGFCYDEGIGTAIDKQKAFELYQNAANLGDKVAQYNLALMYEKGDGIIKDIDKAIYWYIKSARQGDEEAQNKLKVLQRNQN
ncbi:kinase-like domain-containing protein [Rhizophagus clarus]|uniref:Kinase-like domain-containing protein n=1 Tax=Rhizophagus clarus TaxID=94130 RepID=A0A8H3M4Q2_9GLOM|nr:kinase-like domain-containing protein [Rhizophagus clarus]